jgi:hypothetical protein
MLRWLNDGLIIYYINNLNAECRILGMFFFASNLAAGVLLFFLFFELRLGTVWNCDVQFINIFAQCIRQLVYQLESVLMRNISFSCCVECHRMFKWPLTPTISLHITLDQHRSSASKASVPVLYLELFFYSNSESPICTQRNLLLNISEVVINIYYIKLTPLLRTYFAISQFL